MRFFGIQVSPGRYFSRILPIPDSNELEVFSWKRQNPIGATQTRVRAWAQSRPWRAAVPLVLVILTESLSEIRDNQQRDDPRSLLELITLYPLAVI
jgi:hypothetical protein